jgi:hypothetical protein
MSEQNYSFVNGQRGFDPSKGGLWSHWPIPAAKVLMHNQEWAAIRVLTCLVTYLGYGKSANMVWPTIKTICAQTGLGKAKVQEGIKALIAYGFVVKSKKRTGKFPRNEYEILTACYKFQDMNEHAQQRLPNRLVRGVSNVADNKLQITPAINPPISLTEHQSIDYSLEDPFNIW